MTGVRLELDTLQDISPKFQNLNIGQHLRLITDKLLSAGHFLAGVLDRSEALFVDNLLSTLDSQACRIAVIGEINAGKSSFINALVQRPGLLPTGMEPCTAVLTRLNFGNKRQLNGSAQFSFFSSQEWEKLIGATGNSQTAPKTDVHALSHLEKQVERLSAQSKSPRKNLLLQSVTKDVIKSYTADLTRTHDSPAKKLSEITKTADLFVGLYPFRFPTVVIDTPGVNHSTQKRGPITWENINEADIYLVMIKATEGLSHAEISLLKNLYTLREDRIIVLVNHIDATASEPFKWRQVVEDVERQIRAEISEAQFPVVMTSAHWAECALSGDAARMVATFTPQVRAFASETSISVPNPPVQDVSDDTDLAMALFECSGIPATAREIDKLISRADCFNHAHDTVINLLRISYINLALRKAERVGYQDLITTYESPALGSPDIDSLKAELAALNIKRSQMSAAICETEEVMNVNAKRGLDLIQKNLFDALRLYALAEIRKPNNHNHPNDVDVFFSESANAIALKRYVSSKIVMAYREIKREIFLSSLEAHRALNNFIGSTLSLTDRAEMLPWLEKRIPIFLPVSQSIEIDMNDFLRRVNEAKENEISSDAGIKLFEREFPTLLETIIHDMKMDIFNTIAREVKSLNVIMSFIVNRLGFVIAYKKDILQKFLNETEFDPIQSKISALRNELNNVERLELESRTAAEMLKEVYLLVINKRNASEGSKL